MAPSDTPCISISLPLTISVPGFRLFSRNIFISKSDFIRNSRFPTNWGAEVITRKIGVFNARLTVVTGCGFRRLLSVLFFEILLGTIDRCFTTSLYDSKFTGATSWFPVCSFLLLNLSIFFLSRPPFPVWSGGLPRFPDRFPPRIDASYIRECHVLRVYNIGKIYSSRWEISRGKIDIHSL